MRYLRHSPGFAATAILTLATGMGVVVAMFSVYSRVVLNPLSVADPSTVVAIYTVNRHNTTFVPPTLSWPFFEAVRRGTTAFSELGAYSNESVSLSGDGQLPEPLLAMRVSGDFFGALRIRPSRGRLFAPQDDVPNGPAVCVLSYELWQSRFGGRELIGSTIQLDGKPVEVIGTLPPHLSLPWSDRQIFLPRVFDDSGLTPQSVTNGASYLQVIGRLRPGTTIAQAADQLRVVSRAYVTQFAGRSDARNEAEAQPLVDFVVGNRRSVMLALLAAVAVVLLVSCANAAALVLSRLASLQRETAVRQALGATRAMIVRHFLFETATLATLAGIVGIIFAIGALSLVQYALGPDLPPGIVLRVDRAALAMAVVIVAGSAMLVGLFPALFVTRPSAGATITSFVRGMSDSIATSRFRAILVIAEVALSVFLLVGAALLSGSLTRLQHASPGFDPSGVAAALVSLPAEPSPPGERQARFFSDVLERLTANRQVLGAAAVFGLPFHDDNYSSPYSIFGRPILPVSDRPRAGLRIVSDDYFSVMRMQVTQGRAFTASDRDGAPGVCIINESLARHQFGTHSPLGQVMLRGREADHAHTIVGVVADVKTNGLQSATPDEIFYPFRQVPRAAAAIVVRTAGDPDALGPVMQAAVADVDRHVPISRFASMDRRLRGTVGTERVMAGLTTAFAGLALVLAAVGLFAVLAHNVASRTIEIGIRMAMGANRRDIEGLIIGHALRLVAIGTVVGLATAALVAPALTAQLYGVSPYDPWTYGLVVAVFVGVGLSASWVPARRAARVDPLRSLAATI